MANNNNNNQCCSFAKLVQLKFVELLIRQPRTLNLNRYSDTNGTNLTDL